MGRKYPPRLSLRELRDLREAFQLLAAARGALSRSSWAGSSAVIALVDTAALKIGPIYDRGEYALPQSEWVLGGPATQGAPAAAEAAGVASPDPEG
jgi:hypothetical protein